MTLRQIGSNQTELTTDRAVILFSYSTPVAACVNGTFYRTATKHSMTTSKHINQWLDGRTAEQRDQAFFDALVR